MKKSPILLLQNLQRKRSFIQKIDLFFLKKTHNMFLHRQVSQFSTSRTYFYDNAKSVQALSYFDDHDHDEYYSPCDIYKLLHENEYEEVLDGFHIEEVVHEFDEEIYQLYYDILFKK